MKSPARRLRSELIDVIAKRLHDRLQGEEARRVGRFVRQYYGEVAAEDLVGFSTDNLYGARPWS